jgi:hypothetical protein
MKYGSFVFLMSNTEEQKKPQEYFYHCSSEFKDARGEFLITTNLYILFDSCLHSYLSLNFIFVFLLHVGLLTTHTIVK